MPDVTETKTEAAVDAVAAPSAADAQSKDKPRSLWGDAWFDLRHRPMFWISSILLVLLLVIAAFPGLFTGANPRDGDLTNHFLTKPELGHLFQADWFGYDGQGRSIYARVVYGTRASIMVGVGVTAAVTLVGGLLGMLIGYFGGWLDSVISRVTDIFFGIPFLLGAMVVLNAFTDRKVYVVILALAFLGWTSICRVMRASVITAKQADYVTAARALGAGDPADPLPARPAERARPDHRRGHHRARWVHLGRGDALVPRTRARGTDDLVGHRHRPGQPGHPGQPACAAVPGRNAQPHGLRVHHARRRGTRRPRPEAALRRA